MRYTICVEKNFSAAHALRGYQGRCERLHGHNWKVQVMLAGTRLNKLGMLMDFTELKAVLDTILARVDHRYLNEVPPFDTTNPTAENIAAFIFAALRKETRKLTPPVTVAAVRVWESDTSSATVSA
jgi:6-pyruvoyltetrahydropterin/6-carboxytetrahydropterin synthase